MTIKALGTLGGFTAGWFALQESLLQHSKTTQITKEDYVQNITLRNKILRRHNTMNKWLNVDMSHVKR